MKRMKYTGVAYDSGVMAEIADVDMTMSNCQVLFLTSVRVSLNHSSDMTWSVLCSNLDASLSMAISTGTVPPNTDSPNVDASLPMANDDGFNGVLVTLKLSSLSWTSDSWVPAL